MDCAREHSAHFGAARVAQATEGAEPPRRDRSFEAFRSVALLGIAVTVVNPYWLIWWATVGTKLTVDSLHIGWSGPLAVFLGHILSDLLWLTFVATLVGSGSRWLGDRAYRGLLGACAVFLIVLGVLFVVSGVRGVLGG